MPINLTTAQRAVERLTMPDTCAIWRDVEGQQDDTLDPITGVAVRPSSDESAIYSGQCGLRSSLGFQAGVQYTEEGGIEARERAYMFKIPLSGPELLEGDRILMTACEWDPELVGKELIVRTPMYSSLPVSRRAVAEVRL